MFQLIAHAWMDLKLLRLVDFVGESNLQINKTCPSGATTSTLRHVERVDVIETAHKTQAVLSVRLARPVWRATRSVIMDTLFLLLDGHFHC